MPLILVGNVLATHRKNSKKGFVKAIDTIDFSVFYDRMAFKRSGVRLPYAPPKKELD